MKVKIGSNNERKEVDLEIGELVLLKVRIRHSYTLARLEEVVEINTRYFNQPVPHLKFSGDSYLLSFVNVMGTEVPNFSRRQEHYQGDKTGLFDTRTLEDAISGKENIISYLERQGNRYREHAKVIKTIDDRKK